MDRKLFLKRMGIAGIVGALPISAMSKALDTVMDEPSNEELLKTSACTETPGETTGPYPYPGSSISTLIRTDITEGQAGIPLALNLRILNADNSCNPVSGLRVDIWHCNKLGYYSAYAGQPGIDGTLDTTGKTWLRGIQYTDSAGNVNFTTIYPGWYNPRATHIHVQVYNGSKLISTTQVAFPDAINTTVNSFYATSGTNPTVNSSDMVFSDSISSELMTVSGSTAAGYTASIDLVVKAGTVGIEEAGSTGGQLSQVIIYPNPVLTQCTLAFELAQESDIQLTVMDMSGKTAQQQIHTGLSSGAQLIPLTLDKSLAPGQYFLQLSVSNFNGTYTHRKLITKL
jgi:protocatechuate 3,4-dioxygenase beta subunit